MAQKQKALPEVEELKFLRYTTFLSRNKWRIVAGVSLVVGVLLVIGLIQSVRKRNRARAFQAYSSAETPEQYQSVAENFPGTAYGAFSLITAGDLLFEKEKFGEARRSYLKFLRSYPESRFRPWVYNLLGATFEAEKKYDEAIRHYWTAHASPSLELQARLNIGRCWELKGDLESARNPALALDHYAEARTHYRKLTETGSTSPRSTPPTITPWQRQAQSRMGFLREKERKAREAQSEKKVDKDKK